MSVFTLPTRLLATGICCLSLVFASQAGAQSTTPTATNDEQDHPLQQPIQQRLDWFMQGASRGDGDVHGEFWHAELTYTSSSGQRMDKHQLMQGMWGSAPLRDEQVTQWYHARELELTVLDDVVIANFILVAEPVDGSEASYFYNTGVLVEDQGEWRAINWNATRFSDSATR